MVYINIYANTSCEIFIHTCITQQVVANLINSDLKMWDEIKLKEFFAPETREAIKPIPLTRTTRQNNLIWVKDS